MAAGLRKELSPDCAETLDLDAAAWRLWVGAAWAGNYSRLAGRDDDREQRDLASGLIIAARAAETGG
jgi:hypothetical protein